MKSPRLFYILALSAATACNDMAVADYGLPDVGSDLMCATNADCTNIGESCLAQRCTAVSAEPRDIALRLTFPNTDGLSQVYYTTFIPGQSLGTFNEQTPQNVSVSVEYFKQRIDGNVSITTDNAWGGIETEQLGELSASDSKHKVIKLFPGVYTFTVFPSSLQDIPLPTMTFSQIAVTEETTRIELSAARYPSQKADVWASVYLHAFFKNVLPRYEDGIIDSPPEIVPQPQPSMFFFLRDTESSAATAKFPLTIDSNTGDYPELTIPMPPLHPNRETQYIYEAVLQQKITPTLTLNTILDDFPISVEVAADDMTQKSHFQLSKTAMSFDVASVSSKKIRIQLVSDESSRVPSGASVTISALSRQTAASGQPRLSWSGCADTETGENGFFTIDIPDFSNLSIPDLDMDWKVRVVFQPDSEFSSETFLMEAPETDEGIQIYVQPQIGVHGIVTNAVSGEPIPDALLEFIPSDDASSVIRINADKQGFFKTQIDARPYNVTVIPPRASGLPTVTAAVDGKSDVSKLNIAIAPGELVFGSCIQKDGSEYAGVRAELYAKDKNGTAKRVSLSETDASGIFRFFIPAI